jgi:hypothetical protein
MREEVKIGTWESVYTSAIHAGGWLTSSFSLLTPADWLLEMRSYDSGRGSEYKKRICMESSSVVHDMSTLPTVLSRLE